MKREKLIIICVITGILLVGTYAHADLKTLMELGRSQADIAKSLKKETKNYEKVKKAIISDKLEEGMPAGKIRKKYGDPIMDNIYDKKRNAYKWLYMPAASSHFEGEKLYLFVNEDGKLVGWKLVEE